MNREEWIGWYFGYPKCCIKAFSYDRDNLVFNTSFYGTGFVPCKSCAKLNAKDLKRAINKKRIDPSPFPDHSL